MRAADKDRSPVRERRLKLGLSLREMARRLGMDEVRLGEIERGAGLLTKDQRAAFDSLGRGRWP